MHTHNLHTETSCVYHCTLPISQDCTLRKYGLLCLFSFKAHTPLHLPGDANWGRILSAVGYSGVNHISPEKTNVSFIPTDGSKELKLLVNGEPESVDEERAVGVSMPP